MPSALRATPYVALMLGLVSTAVVTQRYRRVGDERDQIRFDNAVTDARDRLRRRVAGLTPLLLGARGLFAASDAVTRDEFRRYAASLVLPATFPATNGLGFVARVGQGGVAALEQQARAEGLLDFHIWPARPRGSDRTAADVVLFAESLGPVDEAPLGLDMSSLPALRSAMDQACDTGQPAVSERIRLADLASTAGAATATAGAGVVMYVPLYEGTGLPVTVEARREHLTGFVYLSIRLNDLMTSVFERDSLPLVACALSAGSDGAASTAAKHRARFERVIPLEVGGRTWQLTIWTTPAFDELSSGGRVAQVALVGVLSSLVLFLMLSPHVRARVHAEESDRLARAQRAHLEHLFMQAPAPILIQRGPDQVLEFMNLAAQELLGPRPLGKPVRDGFPDIDATQIQFLDKVFVTGERFVGFEVPIAALWRGAGGPSERFFNIVHEPMHGLDGRVEGIMTFGFEVTEQVAARKSAEAMAADLGKAVRVRDDFLSIAGHELKTPLTALYLQIQGIQLQAQRGVYGKMHPELIERIGKAESNLERLQRLIGELLDVSRITAGHLELQRELVDLVALVREIGERFRDHLASAGCVLSIEAPSALVGEWDQMRLDQVVTNLLTNAIKYGSGKPIELKVERISDMQVRMTVVDHGIGIALDDQLRIFDRFERAVSERNYGGFGLGLWISRQIVEALGGRISVTSAPHEGSTFVVDLPVRGDVRRPEA